MQLSWPSRGLTVPGAQSVSVTEPMGQKVPTPHVMQSAALLIDRVSVESLRVPPGHGSGAAEPSAQ